MYVLRLIKKAELYIYYFTYKSMSSGQQLDVF